MIARTGSRDGRRTGIDRLGTIVSALAVILALIPLGAMLIWVVGQGAGSLSWQFFTQPPPYGMQPMILGTIEIMILTTLMGVPLGLLSGLYLARAGSGPFPQVARFVTDVIAGTPSILAGVVVAALIVIPTKTYSGFSAAIALTLLMFPTVTRATEAAVRAVPPELREAALGLGSPEWKLMVRVTIPTAAAGIVTAIILGIARVAGETAPLVFTIVGNSFVNTDPFKGEMGALPLQIWTLSGTGAAGDQQMALAGAFVLFSLIVVLNLIARVLTYRLSKRARIA